MSKLLDGTIQFISDSAIHVISQVAKAVTYKLVDSIVSKFSKVQIKPRHLTVKYVSKMFKWENNSVSSSGNSGSGRSIGDKWKSIIGKMDDGPMLEDEDVPPEEFYGSSPEMNRFKSMDDTLLEDLPKWRDVSDESFLKMEQMVKSPIKTPLKRITENEKEVDISNLIIFSPCETKKKTDKAEGFDIESSVADNEYETCESGESRITSGRITSQPESSYNYVSCDSGESRITDAKESVWATEHCNTLDDADTLTTDTNSERNNSQSSSNTMNDSLISSSRPSEASESLKFNDTLEEMEHLLKYGMNYMVTDDKNIKEKEANKSPEPKPNFFEKYCNDNEIIGKFNQGYNFTNSLSGTSSTSNILDNICLPKHNVEKYRDHKEIEVRSPVAKKTTVKKIQKEATANKENKFHLRSPRLVVPTLTTTSSGYGKPSPFQAPKKTPTKPRKFFYDTPPKTTPKLTPSKSGTPLQHTPSNLTPSKYTNIMSPVQYYIKNSPVVPKIQNVSPGINLWHKQSHRAPSKGRTVESPKENVATLTEKAYQPPKVTKLIETADQRLPKNFKVGLMAESLPKPMVIKHERREGPNPLRDQNALLRQHTYTLSGGSRESYAHLNVVGGDVSVCIEKPAIRTHTLK